MTKNNNQLYIIIHTPLTTGILPIVWLPGEGQNNFIMYAYLRLIINYWLHPPTWWVTKGKFLVSSIGTVRTSITHVAPSDAVAITTVKLKIMADIRESHGCRKRDISIIIL